MVCAYFIIRLFFFIDLSSRTVQSDVIQGILVGLGLAFVTAQIYARLKATKVNGWLTMFWLVMIPVSYEIGWLKSVVYVSALSLWALVSGHWSAWQAARVEVEQQRQVEKEKREPVEEKVVNKIVEKTEIQSEKPPSP